MRTLPNTRKLGRNRDPQWADLARQTAVIAALHILGMVAWAVAR